MSASDKTIFNAIKAKKGNIYLISLSEQKAYKKNPDYIFGFDEHGFWINTTDGNFTNEVFLGRVVSDFSRGISYGTLAPAVIADSTVDEIQNKMQQIERKIRDLSMEESRQSKQQQSVTQAQIGRLQAELTALNDESTRLDQEYKNSNQVESTPVTAKELLEDELGLTPEQALSYAASMQQILLYYHRYLTNYEGEPKFNAAVRRENDKLFIELHTETDPELYSKFEILVSDLQVDAEGKPIVAPIRLVETYEIVKPGAAPKIAKVDVTPAQEGVFAEHGLRRDSVSRSASTGSLRTRIFRPKAAVKSASSVSLREQENRQPAPFVDRTVAGKMQLLLDDWRLLNLQDGPAVNRFSMRLAVYLDKEMKKNKGKNIYTVIQNILKAENLDTIDVDLLSKMWKTGDCLERMGRDDLQIKFIAPFFQACVPYQRPEHLQNIVFDAIKFSNDPETKVQLEQVPDYEKRFYEEEKKVKIPAAIEAKKQLAPLYKRRAELEQKLKAEKKSGMYEIIVAMGVVLSMVLNFSATIFGFSPSFASPSKVKVGDNKKGNEELQQVNQRISKVESSDLCKDNQYMNWEDARLRVEAEKINKVLVDMREKEVIPANPDVESLIASMEAEAPISGEYESSHPVSNLERNHKIPVCTQNEALDVFGFLATTNSQPQVLPSSKPVQQERTNRLDSISVRFG